MIQKIRFKGFWTENGMQKIGISTHEIPIVSSNLVEHEIFESIKSSNKFPKPKTEKKKCEL